MTRNPITGKSEPVFAGSVTNINPTKDKDKKEIAKYGLHHYEKEELNDGKEPRVSPILPFTRVSDPRMAQAAICSCYNRTKLPMADVEFRKGFRHVFITRPECYIIALDSDGNDGLKLDNPSGASRILSDQCSTDDDFRSAYYHRPHLLHLLSPHYVTGDPDNFNYLLSNRVQGLSPTQISIGIDENAAKSIDGYTVIPARLYAGDEGSTLDLTFKETKNLDVYECLRLWMLYEAKCYKGTLLPSYNGYLKTNSYNLNNGANKHISTSSKKNASWMYQMHPYDRALDYCATIFDIVTNESATKILYWCKYYGVYPVSATPSGLANNNNGPILGDNMTVNATFRYQKKAEMKDSNLIEFNYNAGLLNPDGTYKESLTNSESFLLREDYNHNDSRYVSQTYLGAAGMFTGTPYIVLRDDVSPILNQKIFQPYLQFAPLWTGKMEDPNYRVRNDKNYDFSELNNYIESPTENTYQPMSYVD